MFVHHVYPFCEREILLAEYKMPCVLADRIDNGTATASLSVWKRNEYWRYGYLKATWIAGERASCCTVRIRCVHQWSILWMPRRVRIIFRLVSLLNFWIFSSSVCIWFWSMPMWTNVLIVWLGKFVCLYICIRRCMTLPLDSMQFLLSLMESSLMIYTNDYMEERNDGITIAVRRFLEHSLLFYLSIPCGCCRFLFAHWVHICCE